VMASPGMATINAVTVACSAVRQHFTELSSPAIAPNTKAKQAISASQRG
jgi:hypothetical protein